MQDTGNMSKVDAFLTPNDFVLAWCGPQTSQLGDSLDVSQQYQMVSDLLQSLGATPRSDAYNHGSERSHEATMHCMKSQGHMSSMPSMMPPLEDAGAQGVTSGPRSGLASPRPPSTTQYKST
jgi:hypothetical protein